MNKLRGDGDYVLFEICCRYKDEGSEFDSGGDAFHAQIPQKLRFIDPGTAKETPLFKEYNDTWQWCGVHGWRSADSAIAVMRLLAQYSPGHRFRVVRRRYVRETETVAEEIRAKPKEES